MCLKSNLVDVLVTYSNLPKTRREVEMSAKIRVLKFIESVVHTRKRVSVLTHNLVKTAVVNAESQRAMNLSHKKRLASPAH
jgi:hypothetical protein